MVKGEGPEEISWLAFRWDVGKDAEYDKEPRNYRGSEVYRFREENGEGGTSLQAKEASKLTKQEQPG